MTVNPVVSALRLEGVLGITNGTYEWPHPLGLSLGLLAVVVGQVVLLTVHWTRRQLKDPTLLAVDLQTPVQRKPQPYDFYSTLGEHFSRYESFVMLGAYLCISWELGLLPPRYYEFDEQQPHWGFSVPLVILQLMCVDFWMYVVHYLEHHWRAMYTFSRHYNHHRITNPMLFDAFNGDVKDTFSMILVPLHITTYCVPMVNVWTYMGFGASFAALLMAIHSEYHGPLDKYLRPLGVGVPADHHVHHIQQGWNFGHLFTYWDRLFGTYKYPYSMKQIPTEAERAREFEEMKQQDPGDVPEPKKRR